MRLSILTVLVGVRDVRLTITSGGQTGADQAALRAARSRGIPTGGWCPKGWLTEGGPAPWLADYGLRECPEDGYPARTRANVRDAGALLWFGNPWSAGGRLTLRLAKERDLPAYVVLFAGADRRDAAEAAEWVREVAGAAVELTLMVAGNRESGSPGIGERVEAFVGEVLDLLGETVNIDSCPPPPAPVE